MQTSTQTLNGSCCVMTKNGTKKTNKASKIDAFTSGFPRCFTVCSKGLLLCTLTLISNRWWLAGDAHRPNIHKCCWVKEKKKCVKMATYTKHIHGCAYRDRRYKSQAAVRESRSQETQDVRRKAQRLSEATTRYSRVNGNRRDIGSMKFWGKRQQTPHAFMLNFAAGYLVWLVDGVCSVRKWGRATRCFWRGDVRVRESRVEYRKHDGKWVFGVKDDFAISLPLLLPFPEPLLRFLSCINPLLHANPSLRSLKPNSKAPQLGLSHSASILSRSLPFLHELIFVLVMFSRSEKQGNRLW